jgi:hypothetical protein
MSTYLRRVQRTDPILNDIPAARGGNKQRLIFEHRYQAANAAAGPTELSAADTVLDGTAAAVKIKVKSGDAGDTDIPITIMGIDEDGNYVEETIITDDVDGTTAVESTVEYKRLIHATKLVATTGNILVRNAADNATYLTIPLAGLDSNGLKLWLPDGWDAIVDIVKLSHPTNAGSLVRGTIVVLAGAGFDNPGEVRVMATAGLGVETRPTIHWRGKGKSDASVTLSQTQIVGDETFYLRVFTVLEVDL